MANQQQIAEAMHYIASHEGSRTNFVLISRACDYLTRHPGQAEVVANALFDSLLVEGRIEDDSLPRNDRA